jgi:hypothetical protein
VAPVWARHVVGVRCTRAVRAARVLEVIARLPQNRAMATCQAVHRASFTVTTRPRASRAAPTVCRASSKVRVLLRAMASRPLQQTTRTHGAGVQSHRQSHRTRNLGLARVSPPRHPGPSY